MKKLKNILIIFSVLSFSLNLFSMDEKTKHLVQFCEECTKKFPAEFTPPLWNPEWRLGDPDAVPRPIPTALLPKEFFEKKKDKKKKDKMIHQRRHSIPLPTPGEDLLSIYLKLICMDSTKTPPKNTDQKK